MKSEDFIAYVRSRIKGDIFDKCELEKLLNLYDLDVAIRKSIQKGLLVKLSKSLFSLVNPVDFDFTLLVQISNHLAVRSHLSFESALFYYGLVTKKPNEICAIGFSKTHKNAFGFFRYVGLRGLAYTDGIKKITLKNGSSIRIASKEKAVADLLVKDSVPKYMTELEIRNYLICDVGIQECELKKLDNEELRNIRIAYNRSNTNLLSRLYSETDGERIWVGGIPLSFSEKDISELFRPFGEVISVKKPRTSPDTCFVLMKNPLDGKQAIRSLNMTVINGKRLSVEESRQMKGGHMYIYALLNFNKRECYVGQTCDPHRRFNQHFSRIGDSSTIHWISKLKSKPTPIILEEINSGYESNYQANCLETVWRLVADSNNWEVVNYPHLSFIGKELADMVKLRINKWTTLLSLTSINN